MTWEHLSLNPQAIENLYDVSPSLKNVRLSDVSLEDDGPQLSISVYINDFPNRPPKRWARDRVNSVGLRLELIGLYDVAIKGWSVQNRVDISLERLTDDSLKLTAAGDTCTLDARFRWLNIARVEGYASGVDAGGC